MYSTQQLFGISKLKKWDTLHICISNSKNLEILLNICSTYTLSNVQKSPKRGKKCDDMSSQF